MKTIVVEIRYDDPNDPDAFTGFHPLDTAAIWSALQRAFPFSRGEAWTVQEVDARALLGKPVGGR